MHNATTRRPARRRRPASRTNEHAGRSTSNNNRRPRRGGGDRRRPHAGPGIRTSRGRVLPTFDPTQFINKNPIEIEEVIYVPTHKFSDFGLHPKLAQTVADLGIESPSPIQDKAIPLAMAHKDVIGLAETGSGKTAAFLLPLIQKTLKHKHEVTLVLTPTRELALQAEAELKKFAKNFKLFGTSCVGGTNIRPQIKALGRHQHFIFGTPGRVLDLMNQGYFPTEDITNVVLDEADRMLDMGFIHDMRKILQDVRTDRQTLFFSATMTKEAEGLVHDFMIDPVTVSVKKKDVTDAIKQDVVPYEEDHKFDMLVTLLSKPTLQRVIIFCAMKHSAEKLARSLREAGVKAESIHGNKTHGQRQKSLNAFKSGNARVLVATDVAARGIHVDGVSHVINYDLPGTFEDYVHRIGRTGRGVHKGEALTFVPKQAARY
ncbi:DEAD/DEAH box helicase [Candidatus Kaiserbacteria bacterium]|nr:DEAD/DEAH box helicase [Candidatus Kaiserbacteria bacterium]